MKLKKSGTTNNLATFKVHLYNVLPTVANGDGGAFSSTMAGYVGSFEFPTLQAGSDCCSGLGFPVTGNYMSFTPVSGTKNLYYLIEARGAYVPISGEVFTPYANVVS